MLKKKKKKFPVLEHGVRPVEGKTYTLIESFFHPFEIVSDPFELETNESTGEITERRVSQGPMTIRGIFQYENKKNANGRVYESPLWENRLKEGSPLMTAVKDRRLTGRIEHPQKDQSTSLRESAILVTNLWMRKPDPDGAKAVMGEAEVLSTPEGAILRALIRDKVKVGISSRGQGQVNPKGVVDEKTFRAITWDVVGSPSTPNAFPSVVDASSTSAVAESAGTAIGVRLKYIKVNGKTRLNLIDESTGETVQTLDWHPEHGETRMSAKKLFDSLRATVKATLAREVTKANADQIKDSLSEAQVSLGEFASEHPEYEAAVGMLQEQVTEYVRDMKPVAAKTATAVLEEGEEDSEDGETEEVAESDETEAEEVDEAASDDDEDEDDTEETDEDAVDEENPLKALLLRARKQLVENQKTIKTMAAERQEVEAVLGEMAAERETMQADIDELLESNASLTAIVQRTTASHPEVAESVEEAIEEAIADDESLEALRPTLERCVSVDEVDALVERLTSPATSSRKDLPNQNEDYDSRKQQKKGKVSETTTSPSPNAAVNVAEGLIQRFTPVPATNSLNEAKK